MIQEVSQSMHPYLSQEERFLTAVLKHDGKELEDMKKDGFIPSEKNIERAKTNGITETGSELLASIYEIAVPPTIGAATVHKGYEPQLGL